MAFSNLFRDWTFLSHILKCLRVLSHKSLPKPMLCPQESHLFNGDSFGLRKEETNENGHHNNPTPKEEKESIFESTEQRNEEL